MSTVVKLNQVTIDELRQDAKRSSEDNVANAGAKKQKIERVKTRNFAMLLGYLGKDYYGMQRNPHMRTIEEDLIGALFKAKLIDGDAFETIQNTNFQRAARTDKGVSATRQICSVKLPEHANVVEINHFLPKEIRVFGLKRVTKGFNCKSQCNARTYSYTLPSFAFAPDDPSIVKGDKWTDEDIAKRMDDLGVIDGKPCTKFKMSSKLKERVNEVLKVFEGTHNFHNFTAKVRPFDPRAMRYIMKFDLLDTHIADGVEFATLQIKGQSFMLHQIRKMVAVAIGVIRNLVAPEMIEECFKSEKMDIPIAPSLGLVLNHVHYDHYNKRYGSDGLHEMLKWDELDEQIQKFHMEFISKHIEETELQEKSMHRWLGDLAYHRFGPRENETVGDEENKDAETND